MCAKCKLAPSAGTSPYCSDCKRTYDREYYQKNKSKVNTRRKVTRKVLSDERFNFIIAHLKAHPCACGESDPIVLEFDHVRGEKKYNVGNMVYGHYSMATLKAEIAKCEVRCANCHRRRTAEQFGWRHSLTGSLGGEI
jgi:hypothetical protein